jgi:1-acyl-sn-glycerol-3-phosphate acyltransferase
MIRFILVISAIVVATVLLLPFQLVAMAFGWRLQRIIPHVFHRGLCAIAGVRIREVGQRTSDRPVLVLSNHVSWLDISVISALAPVVFIAKSEVASWPVFGWLAKLQRTLFVERERRQATGVATREIAGRLLGGEAVVLFAEGTSSDGNRVLPFRSALIGSVRHALGNAEHLANITVQPMSLAYVNFGGLPMGRALRQRVAWYGDADLMPHLFYLLATGTVDVTVSWGKAIPCDLNADRKQIARAAERSVRRMTTLALRATPPSKSPFGKSSEPADLKEVGINPA